MVEVGQDGKQLFMICDSLTDSGDASGLYKVVSSFMTTSTTPQGSPDNVSGASMSFLTSPVPFVYKMARQQVRSRCVTL
jgi:hypothetical protein